VEPAGAGEHTAQLALGNRDRVRSVAAPVEHAGDETVPAHATRFARAVALALLHLQLDPLAGHTGGGV
jgi:hypothetical protein